MKIYGNGHSSSRAKKSGGEKPAKKSSAQSSARREKPRKRGTVLAAVLGTVLGVILIAVAAYSLWEAPPDHNRDGLASHTAEPVQTEQPQQAAEQTPEPTQQPDSGRNENIYNILVAGRDKVGANTDTIMIVSLNTEAHTINVISIPRDTLVNIPQSVKKINTLYEIGLNSAEGNGAEHFMDGMRDILGFSLDGYAIVNLSAAEEIIDLIGGVYFDVPVDMYYEAPDQGLSIAIPKGYQLLDGENSVKVLRFRTGYADADIGRIGTQQAFLKAAASQMISLGNIANLTKIVSIITDNMDTSLSAANISFFAREFLSCKSEDINFMTMPGNYNDAVRGFSYVTMDVAAWLEMVNEYINPWPQEVTVANVNILTRQDGALYATTGNIAGGEDSFLDLQAYIAGLNGTDE